MIDLKTSNYVRLVEKVEFEMFPPDIDVSLDH